MRTAVALGCLLAFVSACAPGRAAPMDAGVHGPEGGVLTFDAAMLFRDAGRLPDSALRDSGPRDSGPRDSGRECRGVAYSCTTVGATSCSSQVGCRRDGECGGVASSCYPITYDLTCISQDGCFWNSSRDWCEGSARSCTSYSSSSSCTGQRGCDWRDTCDGSPTPCLLLGEFECGRQLGCRWE